MLKNFCNYKKGVGIKSQNLRKQVNDHNKKQDGTQWFL